MLLLFGDCFVAAAGAVAVVVAVVVTAVATVAVIWVFPCLQRYASKSAHLLCSRYLSGYGPWVWSMI